MKRTRAKSRSGTLSLRLAPALLACGLIPLLAFATVPAWWSQRGVVNPNLPPDDYALANQGQLKNIAKAAVAEFDAHMPGGAGDALHNLVNGWSQANPQRSDFAPVNLGQVKRVAKPFYDRLITIHYANNYPWTGGQNPPDDFAIANIGQVKHLFRFDLLATDVMHDSDRNTLPDWWEDYYFGYLGVDPSALAGRGDGLTNLQAFQQGLNPIDYYNGHAPSLTMVSGDDQRSPPSSFLPLPFVVKVSDDAGNPLNHAPVTFTVSDGGGLLAASAGSAAAPTLQLRTESDGTVAVHYQQPAASGITSYITVTAAAAQVVFTTTSEENQVEQGLTVSPGNLNEIVNAGQSVARTVTLTNHSGATREFTAELENSYSAEVSYVDSDQPGGPNFIWNDISATGRHLDVVSDADEASETVDLSFDFPYFGDSYQRVHVTANGYVTVGSVNEQYENYSLPNTAMPANEIAAFHTDLDLHNSGDVYYQDYGDRLVIQFDNAARYDNDGFATFQIVLQRDGFIFFYYKEMSGTLEDATVGVQDSTRDHGLTIAYQQPYLKNNLAVRVTIDAERFTSSVENVTWSDSDQPDGPTFVWNDITTTGTHMNRVSNFDDGAEPLNISFPFPYFGDSYSTVFVSSNGFVTLYGPSADYGTYTFPDSSAPATDIAAFQNDLNLGVSGDVYYRDYGDRVVIQFNNAARYAGDGFATFQIVLQRDGTILFYYKNMIGNVNDASVGIQDVGGDKGVTIVNQQPYLKNNLAIRITDVSPWISIVPLGGSLAPGESTNLALAFSARGLNSGTLHGRMKVTTDEPSDPPVLTPITMTINAGPRLSLSVVDHGLTFVEGDNVMLKTVVVDSYGVSAVELYNGEVQIGQANSPGFLFAWQNPLPGLHPITARAVDHRGAAGRSQALPVEVQLDSNHNGLGDQWEMEHLGNLQQTAEGDFDGDGWSNLDEFRASTDPSHFDDADGDGVGDGTEINLYHTDPHQSDSDGDGLPDGWEIAHHLDPGQDDSQTDSDGDGLTNAEEFALGTAPDNGDTDGDGAWDNVDGWPLTRAVAPPRVPDMQYALIDLTQTRIWGVNNSPDGIVNHPLDRIEVVPYLGHSFPESYVANNRLIYPNVFNDSDDIAGGFVQGNEQGSFSGYAGDIWPEHAFLAPNTPILVRGEAIDFSFSGLYSAVIAINNARQMIVLSRDRPQNEWSSPFHAVLWTAGMEEDLGVASGTDSFRLNNQGAVVGFIGNTGTLIANGQRITLPGQPVGLTDNDDVGMATVTGYYATGGNLYIWRNSVADTLPLLGDSSNRPIAMNKWDQIVGRSGFFGGRATAALWENGRVYDLNARIAQTYVDFSSTPEWKLTGASQINNAGMILAKADHHVATGTYRDISGVDVLLLPVEMMVDGNRDGEMSFTDPAIHDKDRTSEQRPYRFWVNDDSDGNRDGEEQLGGPADATDMYIKSLRDLEDFTRLWIKFKGLTGMVTMAGITVQLEWKPNDGSANWPADAGNPAINVFKAYEQDGGNRYLSDENVGKNQVAYTGVPNEYCTALGRVGRGAPLVLPATFLSDLTETQPNKFLLFEGVTEGKGKLVLTLHKNGEKIGEYPPVYFHITNVKKMYERAKATSAPDPITRPSDTAPPASDPPDPTMNWVQDPNGNPIDYSPSSWQETKQYIVFVHGWNMTYDEAQDFGRTMFKRLWQRGYKGRYTFFFWPTYSGLFTYNDSEYRAWKCGESLKLFVASLPGGYAKNLVSHSMGGIVCGSALAKGMSITNYALCHAAVPAASYDDRPILDQGWNYSTPHYDPDPDTRNLSYRYKLNAVEGNLINFYLLADDALQKWEWNNDTPNGGRFPLIGSKPQPYGIASDGYGYTRGAPVGSRLNLTKDGHIRWVHASHEAMAYVAQSPTKTVGADGDTAGSINGKVNMDGYGFDAAHSAEFNFTPQKTKSFYNRILEEFDLFFLP